ncbi:hypothetical protein [Sphingobium sp. RAC03]|uniref:hypothetical protein n=1 Tax=Sphingobium sp. RAC03 TaxID=1843368 RepID=UPI00083CFFFD|nr:hypothetical protein [Sphingobium sp. RAC03]AOF97941.1 hypothetical protein BSY17_2642 [Sphingobium sp. RAC03]
MKAPKPVAASSDANSEPAANGSGVEGATETPATSAAAKPAVAAGDPPPRQWDIAKNLFTLLASGSLRIVDPANGETISHVRAYDQDAGTLTRMKIEDGNLVREGDHFATVVEERAFRVEWIAGEVVA